MKNYGSETALILIDIQNDFCPGGALEVADGDQIVPLVNKLQNIILNNLLENLAFIIRLLKSYVIRWNK